MPEQPDKNIIKELIAHINALEDEIKLLSENISETEDLVTVNKLDIINLKNGLEKMKISMPEVSPDMINKLKELESITGNIGQLEKWKNMESEMKSLKSNVLGTKQKGMNDLMAGLEFMNQKVAELESDLKDMKTGKHDNHEKAIGKLHERVRTVEKKSSFIKHCPGCNSIVNEKAAFCGKCGKKV